MHNLLLYIYIRYVSSVIVADIVINVTDMIFILPSNCHYQSDAAPSFDKPQQTTEDVSILVLEPLTFFLPPVSLFLPFQRSPSSAVPYLLLYLVSAILLQDRLIYLIIISPFELKATIYLSNINNVSPRNNQFLLRHSNTIYNLCKDIAIFTVRFNFFKYF